ncbi:MAG: ATP/GTP-binding protein [Methanosarcinales archaeon]
MYKNLTIKCLRGIKHLKIGDFRQVNLFVGKNNCGKTTLLEGLFLLTGPTNAELPLKINTFRDVNIIDENTWRLVFNKLDVNLHVEISGDLEKPKEKRKLIIKPNMKSETTLSKTTISKKTIDIKDSYSGISSRIDGLILKYSLIKGKAIKPKEITTTVVMKGMGLELKVPKNYKESLRGVFINAKTISGDLDRRFNNIQIKKQTNKIIEVLRQIEPSLDNLSLGTDGIIYCDIGLDRLMPINIMGGGMVRLLSIILAISDTQNGIVLIDEIENGFHPSSQEILWNAIFKSAKEFNVQIFATTHSMECVEAFSSSYSKISQNNDDIRLYRIERKDDDFRAVSYDHRTLEASLESEWEVR